jgi:hypothetical protein
MQAVKRIAFTNIEVAAVTAFINVFRKSFGAAAILEDAAEVHLRALRGVTIDCARSLGVAARDVAACGRRRLGRR